MRSVHSDIWFGEMLMHPLAGVQSLLVAADQQNYIFAEWHLARIVEAAIEHNL